MRPLIVLAVLVIAIPVCADDGVDVIIEFACHPERSRGISCVSSDTGSLHFAPDDTRVRDLSRIIRNFTLRHEFRHAFNGVSARVPKDAIAELEKLPHVKAVHKDRVVEALVAKSVPLVGAPQVWTTLGLRGRGITIAVIDSGIDYNHPSLGQGIGPGKKVAAGYDFADQDSDPMDEYGHGTHVAGIIAGDVAPIVGVAPEATLHAYKVLRKDGTGLDSAILAAIERSMDPNGDGNTSDHVDIINLSLGRQTWGGDDPLVQAVERAVAAGIVVCVAAGNKGEAFTIHTPAIAPSVITVGATNEKDAVAEFTSRGPVPSSWLLKPDVAAPGQAITSAKPGGDRSIASGTSGSTPHVAAIAALLLERHPDWTPAEVKAAIVSTAKVITANGNVRALATGGGRVDAVRAVNATVLPVPSTLAFGVGGATRTLRLTNRGTETQTLTIAAPNVASGATLTVNPASVTIPRDGFADVTVTLSATNALAATEETIAASGNLEITANDGTSLHVPWSVMAGNQIAVAYRGREIHELYVVHPQRSSGILLDQPWTMTVVVPQGNVDLVVLTHPDSGSPRLIVREQVPVNGFTYLTIDPSEATLQLDVAAVDMSGQPLSSRPWHRIAQQVIVPSGRAIEWWPLRAPLLVSPLQSTAIRTFQMASQYFGMHRRLNGLQQNETLTFPTSDWTRQPVDMQCANDCDFAGAIGFGNRIGYRVIVGTGKSYNDAFYVTPSREEGFNFRAYAMTRRVGQGDSSQRKSWTMLSPGMRSDGSRVTFLASDVPWPVDYTPPRTGAPVVLADGPGLMRTSMGPRSATEWSVTATPVGPLGEDLADSQTRLIPGMVNSQGTAVKFQQVFVAGQFVTTAALAPDTYTFRVVNENHRVNGEKARGTLTARFDSRVHQSAPTLTSLRVEDGLGAAVSTIRTSDNSRLLFSARQTTSSLGVVTHAPVNASATNVWWRLSGTTEWQPLPVSIAGSHYAETGGNGPAGTIFAADLQPMSRAALGNVDVRIEVTNEHGGTTEWVLEPAFAVAKSAGGTKRRVVR